VRPATDALIETAHQLRASLYYFHLDTITRNVAQDIAVVKGHIFCRLIRPEQEVASRKFLGITSVNDTETRAIPEVGDDEHFKVPVNITQKLGSGPLPIRIDAIFRGDSIDALPEGVEDQYVTISGFPATIEVREASGLVADLK
jgi:hypothetical protein